MESFADGCGKVVAPEWRGVALMGVLDPLTHRAQLDERFRIQQHREWMLRSYTVTFAFVTFRLASTWLSPWIAVPDDPVATDLDTLLAWSCWAVPLLLAEPLIQLRSMR